MPQQYDFLGKVREELDILETELAETGTREALERLASHLHLPAEIALAALYRAAKRSGYTVKLMLDEIERQLEAETGLHAAR